MLDHRDPEEVKQFVFKGLATGIKIVSVKSAIRASSDN